MSNWGHRPHDKEGATLQRRSLKAIRGWESHTPQGGLPAYQQGAAQMPKALQACLGVVGAGFAHAITHDVWHWVFDVVVSLVK